MQKVTLELIYDKLVGLEERMDRLETRIDHIEDSVNYLKSEVEGLKAMVGALARDLNTARVDMRATQTLMLDASREFITRDELKGLIS